MDQIKLTVLGCGDAFGSGGKKNTSFFVQTANFNFCIDFGASTMLGMGENNLTSEDVDMVLLSHFHGDHFGALPNLILDAAKIRKRKKKLTIISPPGGKENLNHLMEALYPGTAPILNELDLEFISYENNATVFYKGLSIKAYPVIHAPLSLPHALKINFDNKTISYSGDTEWTEVLLKVADQADLFICECNFYEKEGPGHINYLTLNENAPRFNCKKLVLTHTGEEFLHHLSKVRLHVLSDNEILYI